MFWFSKFEDLDFAMKRCKKCGIIFHQYQMSMGDSHHFHGKVWYEPATFPTKNVKCNCEKIMKRAKPKEAYEHS